MFIDLTNCPSVAQDPRQCRAHPRQMLPDNLAVAITFPAKPKDQS